MLCFIFFVFVVFLGFSRSFVYAEDIFFDDFSSPTSLNDNWDIVRGEWVVRSGYLNNYLPERDQESLLVAKTDVLGDFCIDSRIKQETGVDQQFWIRGNPVTRDYYMLGIRYDGWTDSNNIVFYKFNSGNSTLLKKVDFPLNGESLTHGVWRDVRVCMISDKLTVNLDAELVMDFVDSDPIFSGLVALEGWSGAFPQGVDNYWDFVKIFVPIPADGNGQFDRVVLVPGLGASWNTRALLKGESVPDEEWKLLPFLHVYDPVISVLNQVGYSEDDGSLLLYAYDWTTPLSNTVGRLREFLDSHGVKEEEKVALLGHSLGGVLGRSYYQEGGKIFDKIVSLGSPQKGVVQAYKAWAGGEISNSFSLSSLGFELLLKLRQEEYQNKALAVQDLAPVVQDLLPVYEFAKSSGADWLEPFSMVYKNEYLPSLGMLPGDFLYAVNSKTSQTDWKVELAIPSWAQQQLGLWLDGVPVLTLKTVGDGSVPWDSAKEGAMDEVLVDSGHRELPVNEIAVNEILKWLGKEGTVTIFPSIPSSSLFFFLGSPAYLQVDGPEEVRNSDENGFVFFDNPKEGEYAVKVVGQGSGEYKLLLGNSGDLDSWRWWKGEIKPGEVDNWTVFWSANEGFLLEEESLVLVWEEIKNLLSGLGKNNWFNDFKQIDKIFSKEQWKIAKMRLLSLENRLWVLRRQEKDLEFCLKVDQILERIISLYDDLDRELGVYDESVDYFDKSAEYLRLVESKVERLLEKRPSRYGNCAAQAFLTGESLVEEGVGGELSKNWAVFSLKLLHEVR